MTFKQKNIPVRSLKHTFCEFVEVPFTEIENKKPDYVSQSGSQYFYTDVGVYRYSNHWGRIANCKWRLIDKDLSVTKFKVGYALKSNFYPDNEVDDLYFLEFDEVTMEINYQHKLCPRYDGIPILRNASQTAKRLKNARNILSLTNWFKYYDGELTLEEMQKKIIKELVFTNNSLDDIKKKLFYF